MREIDRCFGPIFRDLDGVFAHKLSYYSRLSVGTESQLHSARGKITFFLWQTSGIICGNRLDEKPTIYPLARELYDSHPP